MRLSDHDFLWLYRRLKNICRDEDELYRVLAEKCQVSEVQVKELIRRLV